MYLLENDMDFARDIKIIRDKVDCPYTFDVPDDALAVRSITVRTQ